CGTAAPLKFCPACGQETTLHPPTLGEFLHEFVGHYVALEGTLWRTLGLLVCRPGRLTREYLDGRRRRYVLPLRLYLTASFLFFLVLKLVAGNVTPGMKVLADGRDMAVAEYRAEIASAAHAASGSARPASGARFEVLKANDCGGAGQRACSRVEQSLNEAMEHAQENPQEALERAREHFMHWAPYAIFLLLPAFAGLMQLAYRRRGMTYGEHVVFSLHLHAFWFLAALVMLALPESVVGVAQFAVVAYGVWAMRETYGGRWWPAVLRAFLVSTLYAIVLTIALTGAAIAIIASH
ncbi:MAG: DUF3667 domain-containing protein, partial [Vitreoscilla sp.]